MIILVGSILEIIQQVNSFSLLSKYDFIDKKSILKKYNVKTRFYKCFWNS
jgi:hypothetical protein